MVGALELGNLATEALGDLARPQPVPGSTDEQHRNACPDGFRPRLRSAGMSRPFRFGVVAPVLTDVPTWRDQVQRIADSGYGVA